jgi:hypothetical protein
MTLSTGDLTTLVRVQLWLPGSGSSANPLLSSILIPDASRTISNKLNRARLFYQTFTRTIDGVGNYQIMLPDYPVESITSIQMGSQLLQPAPLPTPGQPSLIPTNSFGGFGYRFVPWHGDLPGDPSVVEMVNGVFSRGVQNIKVTYQAGYVMKSESHVIPATPFKVTVIQPQGIWCQDNGVVYASNSVALTQVSGTPLLGDYNSPSDPPTTLSELGQYTFSASDTGKTVLITYSFVPSDLELACIQLVGENYSYRDRIGQLDKVLGGQETVRFLRGGIGRGQMFNMPPEVEDRIWPYVSVIPPAIGAPV